MERSILSQQQFVCPLRATSVPVIFGHLTNFSGSLQVTPPPTGFLTHRFGFQPVEYSDKALVRCQ